MIDPNKKEVFTRSLFSLKSLPVCLKLIKNFKQKKNSASLYAPSNSKIGTTYSRQTQIESSEETETEILAYCASSQASNCRDTAMSDLKYFRERVSLTDSIFGMPSLRKVPITLVIENIPGHWLKLSGRLYYGCLVGSTEGVKK